MKVWWSTFVLGVLWAAPARAQTAPAVVVDSPDGGTASDGGSSPEPTPPPASASPPAAPAAPPPAASAPPSFGADPFAATVAAADLTIKAYGDVGFQARDNANQPWQTNTSNASVYSPNVNWSFFAPRLDIFPSAEIGKLSFLAEIMFEAYGNNVGVDIERMQLSYLFSGLLRVKIGRMHMGWGYYNDTFHHGNIFELTSSRPYSVNFEDSDGLIMSHLIGVSVDGTLKAGDGRVQYQLEAGNPRSADITAVPMQFTYDNSPTLNARLRWLPIDGLILGVNVMRDVVPTLAAPAGTTPTVAARPETEELVAGAHAVYTEHHFLVDIEGFYMRHNPAGGVSEEISGGFAEVGYTVGAFTPYVRPEYIHFPAGNDAVFQYRAGDPEGIAIGGQDSIFAGISDFFDVRTGVKWLVIPQMALKLEADRVSRNGMHQEVGIFRAAFGF